MIIDLTEHIKNYDWFSQNQKPINNSDFWNQTVPNVQFIDGNNYELVKNAVYLHVMKGHEQNDIWDNNGNPKVDIHNGHYMVKFGKVERNRPGDKTGLLSRRFEDFYSHYVDRSNLNSAQRIPQAILNNSDYRYGSSETLLHLHIDLTVYPLNPSACESVLKNLIQNQFPQRDNIFHFGERIHIPMAEMNENRLLIGCSNFFEKYNRLLDSIKNELNT
jgi:hypothetical protein